MADSVASEFQSGNVGAFAASEKQHHIADPCEQALIRALSEGQEYAYEELIERFEHPVYNLVARLANDPADIADVVQEVFLKIFRSVGAFRGDCSLKTWVYRIAVNEARNHLRWFLRHRRKEVGIDSAWPGYSEDEPREASWMADKSPSPLQAAVDQEMHEMVEKALAHVNPSYRAALVLREVEGLSYEEIAQILETSLGTVKSRIVRGREELRQHVARAVGIKKAPAGWKQSGAFAAPGEALAK